MVPLPMDFSDTQSHLKSTPRDIFLHLLNVLAFYVSVISFIALWIQYIDALYPDHLNFYYPGTLQSILWSTSVLIVAFPARLLTSWIIARDFRTNQEKRNLKIRKWLVYFTLFTSSITIASDLVTLIYNFLNGELSTQFFLKILVVLAVAAAVFAYFFLDLRSRDGIAAPQLKLVMAGASFVVIGSVIAGFLIVGTPAIQRSRRLDEGRINDLMAIQNEVINYWTQKSKLPVKIGDLRDSISGFMPPMDPQTKQQYEYRATGMLSFELCATFISEQKTDKTGVYITPRAPYLDKELATSNWAHGIGRACFPRTIDPELYRPAPAIKPFAPVQ